MAVAGIAIGLHGDLLRIAIVQVYKFISLHDIARSIINITWSRWWCWVHELLGCVASRNSSVCVCKRVQCASHDSKHWVSSKLILCYSHIFIFVTNLQYINKCVNDGEKYGCRVIFGMLIALPITLVYYILLGLWIGPFSINWLLREPRRLGYLFLGNEEISKSFIFRGKEWKVKKKICLWFLVPIFVEHNKST